MLVIGIPAALAVAAAQSVGPGAMPVIAPIASPASPSLAAESAMLANALAGPTLELTMRGTGVMVRAEARAAEDGCATWVTAQAPGAARRWSRMFRWSEVAWTGMLPDGRTLVAFFEHEGRLPGDRLAFAPADPAAFRAALARVTEQCRGMRDEAERVVSGAYAGTRSCYFARMPGLELIEATGPETAPEPTRAVVTLLAHETPEAELRLLFDRVASAESNDRQEPEVAFTVAAPALKTMRIAAARFALDGATVAPRHTIAAYGDTRLRIRIVPAVARLAVSNEEGFYGRLATSGKATLTLLDVEGRSRAVLNFDVGPALVQASTALDKAGWSCAPAVPSPAPAARWQPAE